MTNTMNEAKPVPKKVMSRPVVVCSVLSGVCLLGVVLVLGNVLGSRDALTAALGMATVDKARCVVAGKVIDQSGAPVANAVVRCDWVVTDESVQVHRGMFVRNTDIGGKFSGEDDFSFDSQRQADGIKVQIQLQAGAPWRETLPSEPVIWMEDAISETTKTLQLGEPLPTVPLHVVDTAGEPITNIWVKCTAVEGVRDDMYEPRRRGEFDDGVVRIAVPLKPFKVKVQLPGTGRRVLVGPFDPDKMPERIDVTLPDR